MVDDDILRGWKSIASFLNVNQSTAIRWSKRPGFPIHRPANSAGASVFARRADLRDWLAHSDDAPAETDTLPAARPQARSPRRWPWFTAIGAVVAVLVGIWMLNTPDRPRPGLVSELRDAPESSRTLYLQAQRKWAQRTAASVLGAIQDFRMLIADDPDFQPAFVGLADAHILSTEFASIDRVQAFAAADKAARTAMALGPDDAGANRVAGFLLYWRTRDLAAARPYFAKAVASDPNDYLVRLWYGNVLVDAGEFGPALAELERAAALAPDSPVVQADFAIGMWQAGRRQEALDRLKGLERSFPTLSNVPGWLALFDLQRGEIALYVAESEKWASLIENDAQTARVKRERALLDSRGPGAVLRDQATRPPIVKDNPFWHGGALTAALAASLLHDREAMRRIVTAAAARNEHWQALPFPYANFLQWQDDPVIAPALDRLSGLESYEDFPRPID